MQTFTAEISLPCGDALLAATLVLMTAYAGPAVAGAPRHLLACRIVGHLACLREQAALSPGLREVAAAVHRHWSALLEAAPPGEVLH